MTFLGFSSAQKIERELIAHVIDIVFVKWYEIILSSCYSTRKIHEWNLSTGLEGVHLNFHVPL